MTLLGHVHFEPLFPFQNEPPIQLFLSWIHAISSSCWWSTLIPLSFRQYFGDFSNFSQFIWIIILSLSIPGASPSCLSLASLMLQFSITQVICASVGDFTQHTGTFTLGSNSVLCVSITVLATLHCPSLFVINTIQVVSVLTYVIFFFTHLRWLLHCRRKFDELDMNLLWKNRLLILLLSAKCLQMVSLIIYLF